MATRNCLRHLKKKVTKDQHLLCAIQKGTADIHRFYCCSYIFLTGNNLGVMGVFFFVFFFLENCDKTDEVSADCLKFGILGLY